VIREAAPTDVRVIRQLVQELADYEKEPDAVQATEADLHDARTEAHARGLLTRFRAMADAAGVADPPVRAPARVGELDRSSLAVVRAQHELGWQPRTSLPDGSRAVLDWFRANRL
jgi:nucleoside-diphosphate-sugar epimerase